MNRKVLLVDDIAFVRKSLKTILIEANFDVIGEASNGHEAIDIYRKTKPDIVIMDIVMPGLGGLEATRTLMKMDKDARIIILTAMEQENLVMEAVNAGARDYIIKPFARADILLTLENVLGGGGQGKAGGARTATG